MARKRKGRGVLITLCVIVGIIVIVVAAVRIFLTRERLLAFAIPRVEKAVNATVSIRDIGISFPFGLGVDIEGLSFEKTLPDTSLLSFSSDKVTVRSSLMSLLRRKPEIKAADVEKGALALASPRTKRQVELRGLAAHLSMRPSAEGSSFSAKALVDSILVSPLGGPPAVTLEKIALSGEVESDRDFTHLTIKDARLSWEDLLTAKLEGEVTNAATAPRVDFTLESSDVSIAPVLDRAKSFHLEALGPAKAAPARSAPPQVPIEMSGGTLSLSAHVSGLVKEPTAMSLAFECTLKDLGLKAGDVASIAKLGAEFKGDGVALAWQSLVPSPERPETPAQMSVAWQAVKLQGTVTVEGGDFVLGGAPKGSRAASTGAGTGTPAPPIRISSLKAKAELAGPDVKKVSGSFAIGTSPWTFDASMTGAMPAAAELSVLARSFEGQKLPVLGTLLDRMVNAPVVKLEAAGRSFDARAYGQEPSAAGAKTAAASRPSTAPATQPAGGGAGAILFLKNTTFTAKLDSLIAREAVVTALEAKGTIRDGRMKVDPLTFECVGGKGKAVVTSDLRAIDHIETKIDLSMDGVEASQALSRLGGAANFIQGKFSFTSNASLATGPGVNPLTALTATGNASSNKGVVSFESFIDPLTKIQGFDVTPFRKFDFNDWTGTYAVKNGRFMTDDWKIASSRGNWTIKGSFGFDGTLDYVVHVVIPPAVQKGMKDLDRYKSAFDLMRDGSGNLILDIKVGGTAKHPSASLDISQARSKVEDKLIEGLKKKLIR
jgi:hypothetical protein